MRAEARFANPDDQMVTITLRGTLKQFDDLAGAMLSDDSAIPYWQSQALVSAIRDAAWKLRGVVTVERDSDRHREADETQSGSVPEGDRARAEGIAHPVSGPTP